MASKVEQFLISHGLDTIYHTVREYHFKLKYPSLYNTIVSQTSFLGKCSLYERLYCYTYNIKQRPGCLSCGKEISFRKHTPREYHRYCNSTCAMNDMKTLLGVGNASQLESVKLKKIETTMKNYGVSNPAYIPKVRQQISNSKKQYWKEVYKNKTYTIDGLTRLQYRHRAQQYANTQYERNKHIIDPDGLRGKYYHLDHIYSVTDGFLNDVPINILSDISNLRMISDKDNYKKHKSSHKTIEELYEDYNKNQSS